MRTRTFVATLALMAGSLVTAGPLALGPAAPAAAASTTYYIDPAAGSDTNAGTSTSAPWKTLAKANALTATPGTTILLKAGSTFSGQYLDLKGSGSAAAPATVGKYGTGARPIIDFDDTAVDGEGFGVRITNGSYWHVNDLEITSGQFKTDIRRNGILILGADAGGGAFRHIHIVNNYVHDIFGTDRRTGGINVHARETAGGSPESTFDDVLIQGNTVTNVADTGIQTMTDALLDKSTWTHKTDAFKHVVIRRNKVTYIHRDGILVRAGVGPLVEYNTTAYIGKYATTDPTVTKYLDDVGVVAAQWSYYTSGAVFQYNQASHTRRIGGDGQPWDFDINVTNSVYQYNYSFANDGGVLLTMHQTSGNVFRYNISQNDLDRSGGAFHIPHGTTSLAVYNNVIYRSQGQSEPLTSSSSVGMARYTNNIFYNGGTGSYATEGGIKYANNTFFGANATVAPDTARITSDPLFASPGGATSIADAAAAYTLRTTSTSRDSGAVLLENQSPVLTTNGGIDFAGGALYSGNPDRGAIEGTPAAVLWSNTFDAAGGTWTAVSGNWAVGGTPSGLIQSSPSGEAIAITSGAAWTDYTVTARMAVMSAGGNAGVLFRYADPANFYLLRVNSSGSTLDLYKKVAGTLTLVASQPLATRLGEFVSLRADVRGSTVTAWVDGVQKITWTNSVAQLSAGKVGVRTAASAGVVDEVIIRG